MRAALRRRAIEPAHLADQHATTHRPQRELFDLGSDFSVNLRLRPGVMFLWQQLEVKRRMTGAAAHDENTPRGAFPAAPRRYKEVAG